MSTRRRRTLPAVADPDQVRPATREETLPVGMAAVVAGAIALAVSAMHGTMLLYGDAVAHLGIARGILDTRTPGLGTLGGVWLPLPHLLMLPFIGNLQYWQNGMAGAWPSLIAYVAAVMGLFRLARRVLAPRWALVATAFFGLNANLLYLSSTAMTEPLFLALTVWTVLLLLELREALADATAARATRKLLVLGLLLLGCTLTRYDGWILAALVWLVVTVGLWRVPGLRSRLAIPYAAFTLLALAGPVFWFAYNHVYGHDWLDFLRGPYSPKEIDRRTSPPGAHKYWGWHNPAWSLMLYARTAQVDAAFWETGWLLAAFALVGLWLVARRRVPGSNSQPDRALLLLWLPLPFYVYSISYGSVPIFIPQLYPHSFYNSRYGLEMLPTFAVFAVLALAAVPGLVAARSPRAGELSARLLAPAAAVACVLNLLGMLHATPLVLKEAITNSRGRLALEEPLSQQLQMTPRGSTYLMENSDLVGALQAAGIPLKQTIGPGDYYGWQRGLADPAATANYVIATAGSPLDQAVKAHPNGLVELSILCTTGRPCLKIFESGRFHP